MSCLLCFAWGPKLRTAVGRRIGRIMQPRRAGDGGIPAASDEPVLVGEGRGGGARGHTELGEDVAQVALDRLLAEDELGGDRLVAVARRDEPQDLQLARAEPVAALGSRRVEAGQVRRRAERRVGLACGVELHPGGVLVAEGVAGAREQLAGAGELVWRFE